MFSRGAGVSPAMHLENGNQEKTTFALISRICSPHFRWNILLRIGCWRGDAQKRGHAEKGYPHAMRKITSMREGTYVPTTIPPHYFPHHQTEHSTYMGPLEEPVFLSCSFISFLCILFPDVGYYSDRRRNKMKTNIILLFFSLLLCVTSGCSKTGSFFQSRATTANPSTERPHRYYPSQTSDEEEVLTSPKELCEKTTLKGLAWTGSRFISVTNNGYSFTFCVYSGVNSSDLPREFAVLMSSLEYDSDGRPYLTCPTIPGPSGTFSIPSAINGIPVLLIAEGAFSECKDIEHLILPESLECIERFAFQGCKNLQELRIPSNVQEVASGAFMGCTNLKSIQVDTRSEKLYIGPDAFADCHSIMALTLPEENVQIEQTSFKNAFDLSSMPIGIIRFGNWCLGINGSQIDKIDLPNGFLLTDGFYSDLQKLENHSHYILILAPPLSAIRQIIMSVLPFRIWQNFIR